MRAVNNVIAFSFWHKLGISKPVVDLAFALSPYSSSRQTEFWRIPTASNQRFWNQETRLEFLRRSLLPQKIPEWEVDLCVEFASTL